MDSEWVTEMFALFIELIYDILREIPNCMAFVRVINHSKIGAYLQLTLNCRYYTALNWKSNYINIIKVIYKGWMSTGRARLNLLSRSVHGLLYRSVRGPGLSVTIFPYFKLETKTVFTMFAIYGFRSEKKRFF